jgi:ribose transport system permease protein
MSPKAQFNPSISTSLQHSLTGVVKSSQVKIYLTMVVLFFCSAALQPNYLNFQHVNELMLLAAFLGIVSLGQTLVIITGGIDLSVAYAFNLGGVVLTQVTVTHGSFAAVVVVIVLGILIGLCNGLGVELLSISPMIMTLAMNSILKSVTYVYTNGTPSGLPPLWLVYIATQSFCGIKIGILLWLLLAALIMILLSKTTFGRKVYAVGNSATVSFLSGINKKRTVIIVYVLSSVFAVSGGMLMSGYSYSSYLGMGDIYQLSSVAAVVIGGTSILGGMGGYSGTIAGVGIIYILMSVLTVLNIRDAGRMIVNGMVIIAVLLLYGRDKNVRT